MIQKNKPNTKNYQVISLLNAFSRTELDRFSEFISSPYFNKDQWVIKLFEALKKLIIDQKPFDNDNQIKVFSLVFSEKIVGSLLNKQEKKLLGVKMSVLTRLAKRFLINEGLSITPSCEIELLSKQLLEKKQSHILARTLKKHQQILSENKEKGIEYYVYAFQVELGQMNYLYQNGTLLKEDNFAALIEDLDLLYILNKLKLQATMLSIARATQKEFNFSCIEKITPLLTLYETYPIVILYRSIIQLMTDWQETTYLNLLSLLEQYHASIPKAYLIDFYYVAANFCARQILLGNSIYNKNIFHLYKKMELKDLLLAKGVMPPVKLKNLVVIACRAQEYDWITTIIEKYFTFVKQEIRESVYHYNLGVIDFYKKNYQEAISHFIRVEKINLAYDFDCRLLLLQAYYQMDTSYDERTMQIFRSAEQFVNNNKMMPFKQKKNYKNFIQILISLYRVRHKVGKKTLASIKKKMLQMEVIMAKKWLLEKIDELKVNH